MDTVLGPHESDDHTEDPQDEEFTVIDEEWIEGESGDRLEYQTGDTPQETNESTYHDSSGIREPKALPFGTQSTSDQSMDQGTSSTISSESLRQYGSQLVPESWSESPPTAKLGSSTEKPKTETVPAVKPELVSRRLIKNPESNLKLEQLPTPGSGSESTPEAKSESKLEAEPEMKTEGTLESKPLLIFELKAELELAPEPVAASTPEPELESTPLSEPKPTAWSTPRIPTGYRRMCVKLVRLTPFELKLAKHPKFCKFLAAMPRVHLERLPEDVVDTIRKRDDGCLTPAITSSKRPVKMEPESPQKASTADAKIKVGNFEAARSEIGKSDVESGRTSENASNREAAAVKTEFCVREATTSAQGLSLSSTKAIEAEPLPNDQLETIASSKPKKMKNRLLQPSKKKKKLADQSNAPFLDIPGMPPANALWNFKIQKKKKPPNSEETAKASSDVLRGEKPETAPKTKADNSDDLTERMATKSSFPIEYSSPLVRLEMDIAKKSKEEEERIQRLSFRRHPYQRKFQDQGRREIDGSTASANKKSDLSRVIQNRRKTPLLGVKPDQLSNGSRKEEGENGTATSGKNSMGGDGDWSPNDAGFENDDDSPDRGLSQGDAKRSRDRLERRDLDVRDGNGYRPRGQEVFCRRDEKRRPDCGLDSARWSDGRIRDRSQSNGMDRPSQSYQRKNPKGRSRSRDRNRGRSRSRSRNRSRRSRSKSQISDGAQTKNRDRNQRSRSRNRRGHSRNQKSRSRSHSRSLDGSSSRRRRSHGRRSHDSKETSSRSRSRTSGSHTRKNCPRSQSKRKTEKSRGNKRKRAQSTKGKHDVSDSDSSISGDGHIEKEKTVRDKPGTIDLPSALLYLTALLQATPQPAPEAPPTETVLPFLLTALAETLGNQSQPESGVVQSSVDQCASNVRSDTSNVAVSKTSVDAPVVDAQAVSAAQVCQPSQSRNDDVSAENVHMLRLMLQIMVAEEHCLTFSLTQRQKARDLLPLMVEMEATAEEHPERISAEVLTQVMTFVSECFGT